MGKWEWKSMMRMEEQYDAMFEEVEKNVSVESS